MHLAKGTAHYCKVLAEYIYDTPVNGTVPGNYAVAEKYCVLKPEVNTAVLNKLIDLDKASGVENCVDPLTCGHLALLVLFGNGFCSTALCSFFPLFNETRAQFVNRLVRHYY